MQAIETHYKGYKFRSRLEARWAVFFDAMNMEYQYEPEGIVLNNGDCYLPDFFLPDFNTYVEIKPFNELKDMTDKTFQKLMYANLKYLFEENSNFMVSFGDPYDSFYIFHKDDKKHNDIDYIMTSYLFYINKDNSGVTVGRVMDIDTKNHIFCTYLGSEAKKARSHHIVRMVDTLEPHFDWNPEYKKRVSCQFKARQARFEHGECG